VGQQLQYNIGVGLLQQIKFQSAPKDGQRISQNDIVRHSSDSEGSTGNCRQFDWAQQDGWSEQNTAHINEGAQHHEGVHRGKMERTNWQTSQPSLTTVLHCLHIEYFI